MRSTLRSLSRFVPLYVLLAVLLMLLFQNREEREPPGEPRLAADPRGAIVAGCQLASGPDGEYELSEIDAASGEVKALGRYRGELAGLAVDSDGRRLALTRDGALVTVGDDPVVLANADDRWRMLALAWSDGAPAAVSHAGGRLAIATPDGKGSWRGEDVAAEDRRPAAALVAEGDALHLIWGAYAPDLSRGALRHLVRRDGVWKEEKPIPLGNLSAFAAAADPDGLSLAAVVVDPVDARAEPVVKAAAYRKGEWTRVAEIPADLAEKLGQAADFAAVRSGDDSFWLTTGSAGAALVKRASNGTAADETLLAPGVETGPGGQSFTSLLLLALFVFLAALHCRRSRELSRRVPGLPADLVTRAVALSIDWFIVSIGVAVYHVVAGDINIYQELLTLTAVNELFWINLGAVALFCAIMEGLYGWTPGKRLAGIRVRSALGGPASFTQALLRNLARVLDMFPLIFPGLIGVATAMMNPRRQRAGDAFASTVVRRHSPVRFRRVILASSSPRRKELLEARGLHFVVVPPEIDEAAITGSDPEETVRLLAEAKARAVGDSVTSPVDLVIAADTMVLLDDKELGKPTDAANAARMLRMLSGRSHAVVTGVTVWDPATGQGLTDVERTEVEFRELSDWDIERYVATGDPLDKAGAYGVQTGNLVKQVRGSLSNVAGLPMEMLEGMLARLDS